VAADEILRRKRKRLVLWDKFVEPDQDVTAIDGLHVFGLEELAIAAAAAPLAGLVAQALLRDPVEVLVAPGVRDDAQDKDDESENGSEDEGPRPRDCRDASRHGSPLGWLMGWPGRARRPGNRPCPRGGAAAELRNPNENAD
jgi:hypothetical protein